MSDDLRNEAEVFAVLLELRSVMVADVVAWATSVIGSEEHPHWSVCELSTMGSGDVEDVVRTLRNVPGVVDHDWVRGN